MKIIVAGGRDFDNYEFLDQRVQHLIDTSGWTDVEIVSGRAKGADSLGEKFAALHGYQVSLFPADWEKFGKRAGFIRNHEMGDYADVLIAFWDTESHGTKDMIDYMKGLGKPAYVYYYRGPKFREILEKRRMAYWSDPNPEPWTDPSKIPDIPVVRDQELWKSLYEPGIIRRGGIPKESLIPGHRYSGACRNASEAVWNGKLFEYRRYKWGTWESDTIEHFSDNPETDIFIPIKDLGEA